MPKFKAGMVGTAVTMRSGSNNVGGWSGTGMCPSLLAQGKSSSKDDRCTKFCRACEKPFHDICSWVYHHILKGFDVDKEVWRRELIESPVHSEGCETEQG